MKSYILIIKDHIKSQVNLFFTMNIGVFSFK